MFVYKFLFCVFVWNFVSGSEDGCPPLPGTGLVNGRILRIDRRTVRMQCHPGYHLLGHHVIRCHQGNWTLPFDAYCLRPENECQQAPEVTNADQFGNDRKPGSQVFYHCHEEYFMMGNKKIVCGTNRHWDRDPPVCIAKIKTPSELAEYLRNQFGTKEDIMNNTTSYMHGQFLGPEVYILGLELFFLLDRSTSVESADLELAKSFLKKLLDTFGTDNSLKTSKTRLAVIAFGDRAEVVCALNDETVNSTEEAFRRINTINAGGGGTAMEPALTQVITNPFRKDAKRALFLITDGEPNIGDVEPEDIARILKSDFEMEIFTVGIGREIRRQRLAEMASEPTGSHTFFLQGFQDFKTILDLVQSPPTTVAPIPPPSAMACGIVDDDSQTKPWLTAIVVQSSASKTGLNETSFCAGILLCSQWVLTSGGCFQNRTRKLKANQIFLSIGVKDLTAGETGTPAYALEVHLSPKHQEIHDYNFRLALVKLDRPLPPNAGRPICLPQKNLQTPLSHNLMTLATLEGWGTQSWNVSLDSSALTPSGTRQISRGIAISLLEENSCNRAVRRRLNATTYLREKLLCTGDSADISNECAGSLGSPLVAKDTSSVDERYRLLGIQTDLRGCRKGPVVYVDPLNYLGWIKSFTGDCQQQHLN